MAAVSNKQKMDFLKGCRAEFKRLNGGKDSRDKYWTMEKVKGIVAVPEIYAVIKKGGKLRKLSSFPNYFCVKGNKGERSQEVMLLRRLECGGCYYDHMHKKRWKGGHLGAHLKKMVARVAPLMFTQWLGAPSIPYDYKVVILRGEVFMYMVYDQTGKKDVYTYLFNQAWERIDYKTLFTSFGKLVYVKFNGTEQDKVIPSLIDRTKLRDTAMAIYARFNSPTLLRVDLFLIDGIVYFCELESIPGIFSNSQSTPAFNKSLVNGG